MNNFANKYIKMQLMPKLDKLGLTYLEPEYIYYKLGKVYEQENYAAFAVEIEDFVGNFREASKYSFMLEDKYLTLVSYAMTSRTIEITREEFQDALMEVIKDAAKTLQHDEVMTLPFMSLNHSERRNFLKTLAGVI
jgi:hypothetical protein